MEDQAVMVCLLFAVGGFLAGIAVGQASRPERPAPQPMQELPRILTKHEADLIAFKRERFGDPHDPRRN